MARTARTGSAALATETGASTISTPAGRLADLVGGREQQDAHALLRRDRRARRDLGGPEVGAVGVDRDRDGHAVRRLSARDRARGALGATTSRPRVGAAHGAHAMRQSRTVARRARVVGRRRDLVLGATLRRAGVRLLLLRDGHERRHRVAARAFA